MALTPFEAAKRCPKCEMTGKEVGNKILQVGRQQLLAGVTRGARILTLECVNSRCRWYETPWTVQVNPDGTIPDPSVPREKKFQPLDPALAETYRNSFETLEAEVLRQGRDVR